MKKSTSYLSWDHQRLHCHFFEAFKIFVTARWLSDGHEKRNRQSLPPYSMVTMNDQRNYIPGAILHKNPDKYSAAPSTGHTS